MVCVAPLVDEAEVRQFLKDAVAGGVALVERRFYDGISAGEIPSDFPVAPRASQVLDLGRGLTMRAQMAAHDWPYRGGGRVSSDAAHRRHRQLLDDDTARHAGDIARHGLRCRAPHHGCADLGQHTPYRTCLWTQ